MPSSGGEPSRLTRFRAAISSVHWSPDGRSLYAIVRESSGAHRLYRVPVAGSAPVALQMAPTGDNGVLSSDGSQYAYAAFEGGFAFVEVTPTSGGPPRRITRATEDVYEEPGAWSPDGTRLAVSAWGYGSDATSNVFELSVSDGAKRQLTQIPRSFEWPIAYTRDGTQVLFVGQGGGSSIMRVAVADVLARAEGPAR